MSSVTLQAHRVSDAGFDLSASTIDFSLPLLTGIGIRLCVEASNQLESEAGTLVGRQAEDVREDVGRSHWWIVHGDSRTARRAFVDLYSMELTTQSNI
ncbi:MAG TPA: hypothetical protein VGM90_24285 [Kofleriaceae bacterium]